MQTSWRENACRPVKERKKEAELDSASFFLR
jgi:hypothetical protein